MLSASAVVAGGGLEGPLYEKGEPNGGLTMVGCEGRRLYGRHFLVAVKSASMMGQPEKNEKRVFLR
jgi:hypothetical protein